MLEEQFEAEQTKKLKEADKEAVDRNETALVIRGLAHDSKAKRESKRSKKLLELTPSSCSTTSGTRSTISA